jgi:hypothetical protein
VIGVRVVPASATGSIRSAAAVAGVAAGSAGSAAVVVAVVVAITAVPVVAGVISRAWVAGVPAGRGLLAAGESTAVTAAA